MAHSEELGRYLVSTTGVPAGETVMVLPPNLIQSFAEVRDYNTVIQARTRVVLVCALASSRSPLAHAVLPPPACLLGASRVPDSRPPLTHTCAHTPYTLQPSIRT